MILPSFSAIDRPHAPAPHTAAAAADDDDRRAPPPGDPRKELPTELFEKHTKPQTELLMC
uniref:Uncharacterized protein n=1 Tax=Oryza meridionalis TaxID=40149 RepID=A0A0E0ECD6_9ORYZ